LILAAERMSKAFTKEAAGDLPAIDDGDDGDVAVPSGKNYMTPLSFATLKKEYDHLHGAERPRMVDVVSWAASNGDRSENADYHYGKKRLREIDRRLRYIGKRLQSAVVVDPAAQPNKNQIFFGATVTYADAQDRERTVTIVGEDEADITIAKVSWISPVARALLRARVGDVLPLLAPGGLQDIEVLAIAYPDAPAQ
jgi:transcription elongation factor GreB